MNKLPAIGMLATAVLLVYSFFMIHPDTANQAQPTGTNDTTIQLYVNGEKLQPDVPPQIEDGRTFVPIRWVSDALGANIGWEPRSKSVTIDKDGTVLQLSADNISAAQGGETVQLDAAPFIYQNRTFVPVRWISEAFALEVVWESDTKTVSIQEKDKESLPVVGNVETLQQLLMDAAQQQSDNHARFFALEENTMDTAEAAGGNDGGSAVKSDADFSDTNTQVDGVDEADIVKTDGNYIFQLNNQQVFIARAKPADEMSIVNTIDFKAEGFEPYEMFVDNTHLIVIGNKFEPYAVDRPEPKPYAAETEGTAKKMILPSKMTTMAIVYDRQDIEHLEKIRELELDGQYVTSRKVQSSLYLVTNRNIPMYRIMQEEDEIAIPLVRDSAASESLKPVDLEKMLYRPDRIESNYLIVAGVNLEQPEQEMDVTTFLGAGNQVYASNDHLYAVATEYEWSQPTVAENAAAPETESRLQISEPAIAPSEPAKQSTKIYKFTLDSGTVEFATRVAVPGRILNQFSMGEHNGHFRIATTTGDMWRSGEHTSKNHLYVLDEQLQITGAVEDLAPGERIYSVRFMGDRGYVVTFRNVDPLFVVDLANPENPELLGKLKIPGFSDYLHPYDENHLIGFGMDTIVVEQKDANGEVVNETAFTQGMKMSLFDITDVHNPIEKFTETIGDRGTSSALLRNHKALMFASNKNVMAFPVTVMETPSERKIDSNGYPIYGDFAFQGAYVYNVDVENGFQLQTRISHITDEEMQKSGQYGYPGGKYIERTLVIGDAFYTLSEQMIQAHHVDTFEKLDQLELR